MALTIAKERIKLSTSTSRKPKSQSAEAQKTAASESGGDVTVRMYCHGLGDCFLLSVPREGSRPFYMLIDCGVILGTQDSRSVMNKVVSSVAEVTTDIDVLVVTHEHWDHVSGFVDAEEEFKKLTVHNVWVGWTENPGDPLARKLRAERKRTITALTHAAARMRAAEEGSERSLMEVLGFFGPAVLGIAGGRSTEDAMSNAIGFSSKPPRYCRPADEPFVLADLAGVRFYVLGPPQNEQRIKRALPTKAGKETYESSIALGPETAFMIAACNGVTEHTDFADAALQELARPFDNHWSITSEEAKELFFFRERYFGDKDLPDQSWRNIDSSWLGTAGQLALQLDSYTNNTSLVLAIEFTESKKVFLFAADAQVGNWLSWGDQTWPSDEGNGMRNVTVQDLLGRTVLYKVGHHGSHNATLRANGLELMTDPELIALIPVNHTMAVKKHWDGMPFPALMKRLMQKTSGRVLRIDDEQTPAERLAPEGTPESTWSRFQKCVTRSQDRLYYQVKFPGLLQR